MNTFHLEEFNRVEMYPVLQLVRLLTTSTQSQSDFSSMCSSIKLHTHTVKIPHSLSSLPLSLSLSLSPSYPLSLAHSLPPSLTLPPAFFLQ